MRSLQLLARLGQRYHEEASLRVRKVSDTGDFVFGSSEKDYLQDVPGAVAIAVQGAMLLWSGEWFLDNSIGVPYIQGILGKHSKDIADTTIKDQILQVQGVTNIEEYSSAINPDTRRMSVNVTINTLYGITDVQIQNAILY